MSTAYKQTVLFTPPRLAEEKKTYWPGMQQFNQRAVASTQGGIGLGRLGNDVSDVLSTVHNNFMDLVGTFTGAKGQEQARQDALAVAQLQAQQAEALAQSRAVGWGAAAPWLALGGAVVAVAIIVAARK